jgi:Fic family protein
MTRAHRRKPGGPCAHHEHPRHEQFGPEAAALLEQTLVRGEIERGEASRITGLAVRTAQRLLNDLVDDGLLASSTPKGPVSLRFPAHTLEELFPRLYPLA